MKVRATQKGIWPCNDGKTVMREAGEVFDYDGPLDKEEAVKSDEGRVVGHKTVPYFPSWMEPVE